MLQLLTANEGRLAQSFKRSLWQIHGTLFTNLVHGLVFLFCLQLLRLGL